MTPHGGRVRFNGAGDGDRRRVTISVRAENYDGDASTEPAMVIAGELALIAERGYQLPGFNGAGDGDRRRAC